MKPPTLTADILSRLHHVKVRGEGADLSCFPDFLIVGPQRTGTTWLYHNLKCHPQIFLPRDKETFYFKALVKKEAERKRYDSLDDYLAIMRDSPGRWIKKSYDALRRCGERYRPEMRGEATASYATLPGAVIADIAALNPDIKAIVMLRDPVERALSHAKKDLVRDAGKNPSELSVEDYQKFFRAKGQRNLAKYGEIISRWEPHLAAGNLMLGEFRQIAEAPEALLGQIHRFLGVREGAKYLHPRLLRQRINPAGESPVPEDALAFLRELLAEEVEDFRRVVNALPGAGIAHS
ncbi:MAG: sulfotransferase [Verrucomicrobiales bacterium]